MKSTWALGGMSLVLVMLLAGSGTLMLFSYQPFPEFAYASVEHLENKFIFGQMTRGIHYFSANLLVMIVFAHMLRVFFTGGYQGKRRLNWIIGLCIFSVVLLSCFTGYLLPWDQTAFWAVTICINMFDYVPAGSFLKSFFTNGHGISEKTLQLFFTLHTTLIPSLLIVFLATHFWKIRKAKGVVTSGLNAIKEGEKQDLVAVNPNLLLREAVAALVLIAFVMMLALVFNAPLDEMANAGLSPNPAKAPWYFSGFQELLLHFHPFFAVFLIPAVIASILISMPFWRWNIENKGIWFISDRAKNAAKTAVFISVMLTPGLIFLDEVFLDFQKWFPNIPGILSTGLIPFVLVLILIFFNHFGMKKKFKLSYSEAFQTSAVFLITAFVILTLTCIWLRGAGMKLDFIGGT
ncbi:MAG: cytochrome b N-terminal domain-containing protein [Thermodesulfobacteriota bacterium]